MKHKRRLNALAQLNAISHEIDKPEIINALGDVAYFELFARLDYRIPAFYKALPQPLRPKLSRLIKRLQGK